MRHRYLQIVILLSAGTLTAQQQRPLRAVHDQAPSKLLYSVDKSSETVDITNVAFEVIGPGIPGRPVDERLALRKTTQTKQVLDEVEPWCRRVRVARRGGQRHEPDPSRSGAGGTSVVACAAR